MANIVKMSVQFEEGSDLDDTVETAKKLAKEFGVDYVTYKFRGVPFIIGADACVEQVHDDYYNLEPTSNLIFPPPGVVILSPDKYGL